MQDFKKLNVWVKAHDLTLQIYKITSSFPNLEQFGVTSQLRRACLSIPTNIAEECGRNTSTDFARFLQIAMGSACEVEYLLFLALELSYLEKDKFNQLNNDYFVP